MKNYCKYIMPLLAFFFVLSLKTSAYASDFKYSFDFGDKGTYYSNSDIKAFKVYFSHSSDRDNTYDYYYMYIYSRSPLYNESGAEDHYNDLSNHAVCGAYVSYPNVPFVETNGQKDSYPFGYITADISSSGSSDWVAPARRYMVNGDDSGLDFSGANLEGTVDNPIIDDNIGTLILDKTIMYEESNGNDINDLYNLWSWKNKTSTGYSLSDNDYAQTFIQVKVESKCVIYSDLRHKKVKQNFDNYGEKGMLFNQIPVNNQPLKVSYLTDVPKALPLTHAESHNPLYVGYNYTLYFRVVCTNSTQVIPVDSSSSEWHCGGWRAMDCNADVLNSQSDKSSNGHFDDDDNWIADEDDGNNDVTAGSDSVHDTDDAKDSFANYQPSSGMSTDTAIGNLKDLMNMVGYIPTMIGTLFSFLPSWCTTLIGVTFASMLVLIVYKLIRG